MKESNYVMQIFPISNSQGWVKYPLSNTNTLFLKNKIKIKIHLFIKFCIQIQIKILTN